MSDSRTTDIHRSAAHLRRALIVAVGITVGAVFVHAQAPSYTFQTLAGAPPGSPFWYAHALTVASDGTIYVYDSSHFVIRKVTPTGQVSIFAGKLDTYGSTDGVGTDARFGLGYGIAVNSQGNVYVADTINNSIRKITPDGTVTTLAGPAAGFHWPEGIAADTAGNVYVGDSTCTVQKITADGVVSTLAGLAGSSGNVDGVGSAARFGSTRSLAVDASGNVYVSDGGNQTIRRVTPEGNVTTLAGLAGPPAFVDGVGSAARFMNLNALTIDGSGTLLVGDACAIRTATADGTVTTIAGGVGGCGTTDGGSGSAAQLQVYGDNGIGVNAEGTVYFLQANQDTPALRLLTPDRVVTTLLPATGSPGLVDGPGQTARFSYPQAVAFDRGMIYEADAMRIRTITSAGVVKTLGQLIGSTGGVTVGAAGLAYATVGCGIQTITAAGTITTLAGTVLVVGPGACDTIDGFNWPTGLAVDSAGTVYVADTGNHTIRTVTAQGEVATLAGLAGQTGSTDATGSAARFNAPAGLVVDRNGTLYVADNGNHTIRTVTPAGVVTTLAGQAGQSGSTDGVGAAARFNHPYGLAIDSNGNLYVADTGNSTIRMIAPDSTVTTLGGVAGSPGHADGTGAAATFSSPKGIAVDDTGTLYIADTDNYMIRLGLIGTASAPVVTTQPAAQTVSAGQDAQFTVAASGFPSPGYQWQVSNDGGSSWQALMETSTYSGTFTPTLTVKQATGALTGYQFRCVLANVAGTATSSAASLTVYGMNLAPASLYFGAIKAGASGALTAVTPAQDVSLTFAGPSSSWTVTADQPWVQITNGSGTGAGHFSVGISDPTNPIGASTSLTANVTATAGNGMQATLRVTLAVQLTGTGATPFGVFDTPVNGATGLQGSFAVTGWALDDIGIDRVEIWRDPVAGETTPPYTSDPSHPAYGKIFIANPTFIKGSRPDVERLYASRPFFNRSGWGYLLLSWGLWNQGNTTYTLYAYAFDIEGHNTLLGTKTITVDNAHATKPFGAIDTPGYGATVSGGSWNYGWALTPNATPACTIRNGHVQMNIDSEPLVAVTYGDLRTDIAASFPGFSDGNNAGGEYYLDTTQLSDGMHQIGWFVTDDCGRQDGIGSRFFWVLNGSSDATTSPHLEAGTYDWQARDRPERPNVLSPSTNARGSLSNVEGSERQRVEGNVRTSERQSERAIERRQVSVPRVDRDEEPVQVRQIGTDWETVLPNAGGTRVITVDQTGRIEVRLPQAADGSYSGFLQVDGERRPLPLGSSLDSRAGIFYWQPAAGFLGTYDLVFTAGDSPASPVRVRVIVGPSMRIAVNTPSMESGASAPLTITGWALDLASADGSGVDAVEVWVQRRDAQEAPRLLGTAQLYVASDDAARAFGSQFDRAGFELTTAPLPPGQYDVFVNALPHRTGNWERVGIRGVKVR